MDKLLIIGAGEAQLAGIRRAREMGYAVIAVDANPGAPGLALAHRALVTDIKNAAPIIDLARAERVCGVCAFSVEAAVRTVAAVAEALHLPGPSREAAMNATDKQRMRELWAATGLPSPASIPCYTLVAAEAAMHRLGGPVVVKPADSAGSRGVSLVASAAGLPGAFAAALHHAANGVVLVETFMAGVEMSVEGFMTGGRFVPLACSDKIRTAPPHLLDTTVLFPSEQPAGIQARAIDLVGRAALALGLDAAPVHAEVMVTAQGPMMVELAARGPGFKVFTGMLPWVTGIDGVGELIRLSVGSATGFAAPQARGAVLRFPEVAPGRVARLAGIDTARSVRGVTELEIYCREGDTVRPLASGADRVGHIIALAETRGAALAAVLAAEAALTIETVAA
jgi:biotin carboxylase